MKERIRTLLEEALPLVDFDSDFLFSLDATDATPRNLRSLDSIVDMVKQKVSDSDE